jgi:hypothetical protein
VDILVVEILHNFVLLLLVDLVCLYLDPNSRWASKELKLKGNNFLHNLHVPMVEYREDQSNNINNLPIFQSNRKSFFSFAY